MSAAPVRLPRAVDAMRMEVLMEYADKTLGVETMRVGPDGKQNRYRPVYVVRMD